MSALSVIFGLEGPELSAGEKRFFRDSDPWAFILFARNVETPAQLVRLTADLRECVGRECLVFIDQEGGRVQRLRPPHWNNYPALSTYAFLYSEDRSLAKRLAFLHHRLIADDLRHIGVTASCAPVLDIPVPNADAIISDRALGLAPPQVIDLAHACMAGLMQGGVAPVVKHIPGHGRATVDSHKDLPVVREDTDTLNNSDFAPFQALNDAPMAMTAHIVFSDVDDSLPITLSRHALQTVIRDQIGYDGLLMTDDLDMKALSGTTAEKTRKALDAGCDVILHCSGNLPAMVEIANEAKTLSGESARRADIAQYCAEYITAFDRESAWQEFTQGLNLSIQA